MHWYFSKGKKWTLIFLIAEYFHCPQKNSDESRFRRKRDSFAPDSYGRRLELKSKSPVKILSEPTKTKPVEIAEATCTSKKIVQKL